MSRSTMALVIALVFLAAPAAATAAGHRPKVTSFSFAPATFAVPRDAATSSPAEPVTRIRFHLSNRARVRIAIARKLPGRMSRGRCARPAKRLRKRRACTRHVFRGALTRKRKAGASRVPFSGRIRHRRLQPGRYRATIVASNGLHSKSTPRTASFRITRAAGVQPPAAALPQSTPAPPPGGFPSPATTGVPPGWVPAQTRTTDLRVTQAGAVVQDVLLQNASINVEAPNVTIRRVRLQGGRISNFNGSPCQGGMVIEDSTIEPAPGEDSGIDVEGVIEAAGYTARRVKIWRRSEGFRATEDCGQVRVEDSFAKIVVPDGRCDLHSDGIQGYGAPWTTVVNSTIDFVDASCGTAPFFIPKNQGNIGATVDRLLVMGGGYPFRMGVPGTVSGLKIVNKSWVFGPIDVACSLVSAWEASIVTITPDYQVASTVRPQRCNTETGN
jgi:hypothetical protein